MNGDCDARVAAAYEAAAEMLAVRLKTYSDYTHNLLVQAGYDVFANRVKPLLDVVVDDCPKTIRALTPDDAKAALEAVRREARAEALREAAEIAYAYIGPEMGSLFYQGINSGCRAIKG
ncbi:hypothetical protein KC887_10680, partial [Candidatus Kaiserbacteria bacterium]|nr:hypothetical protein [Candidatus Kaiserbacteria bacterium]